MSESILKVISNNIYYGVWSLIFAINLTYTSVGLKMGWFNITDWNIVLVSLLSIVVFFYNATKLKSIK